jgi:hypothetical protein
VDQNEKIENTTIEKSPTPLPVPVETNVCSTITLFDEPEEIDGFGSHRKVAQAIAALIEPDDAKGIGIGIEGPWGSGKSTVARLLIKELGPRLAQPRKEENKTKAKSPSFSQRLRKLLVLSKKKQTRTAVTDQENKNDNMIAVVAFDAWAHEGDPLRRTFLETIIEKLQTVGWVEETRWEQRKQILANQREEVTTEDNLSITPLGRALVFTLLLIPIGGAFLNAALREGVTFEPGPIAWKFVLGVILSFSPLFVLLLGIKKERDLLSLFLNKGPTRKSTVTSRTANPTSIEFEKNFMELLKEALEDNDRRIVLILDNLDRVEPKDALSIWSTLQTFFQHKGTTRPKWQERLWLLVLYDYSGLSQLWAKGENGSGGSAGNQDGENGNDENSNDENGGNTALSFIDKSFQVRFEVPPLVLSDWRTFLMGQLKAAFQQHSDDDHYEVYRVLATNVAEKNKSLTIRELKLFVNQIGAIHRQWAGADPNGDAFSLPLIAYYVLLRRDGIRMLRFLRDPNPLPVKYQELLGSDIRESFAALFFNVEVSAARQLLFSDPIKKALTEGDPKELTTVASLLSKGFWDVFERIAKDWASSESLRVADAALALEESGLAKTADGLAFRSVMRAFSDSVGSVQAWSPFTETKARGLGVILKWKNELRVSPAQYEVFATKLFEAIALGFKDQSTNLEQSAVAEEWLDHLNLTVKGLEVTTKQAALTKVVETVAEQFTIGSLQPYQRERCLEVLVQLGQNADISANVEKQLRDLSDKKAIEYELIKDPEKKPAKLIALMIYVLVRYSSTFTGLPTSTSSPDNRRAELSALISDGVIQSFAGLLDKYQQTSLLFSTLQTSEDTKPLVVGSLKILLNNPEARNLFSGPDAIDRLEFAFSELGTNDEVAATLSVLLAEIQKQSNVARELTRREFKPRSANLYLQVLQSGNVDRDFISWSAQGLRSASSLDWETDLYRRGPMLALAFHLNSVTEGLELGEQYFNALKKLVSRMDDQEWPVPPHRDENLFALVGPLGSDNRTSLQRRLRKYIEGWTGDYLPWFFQVFGQELLVQLDQASLGADLLEKIFASEDRTALEWLRDALAQRGKTLETEYANKPEWFKFKAAVRQALMFANPTTETFPLVQSIATILHVKPLKNGAISFAKFDGSTIVALDPGATEELTLIQHPFSEYPSVGQPAWSPDGKKVAFIGSNVSSRDDIFVLDVSSANITQVTNGPGSNRQPSWSPDGKSLAFTRVDGPRSNIFTIDLETLKQTRLPDPEWAEHPDWSPDGRLIVFQRKLNDHIRQVVVMNADGSNPTYRCDGSDPSWSPDGELIAFVMRRDESRDLLVLSPHEGEAKLVEKNDVYNPVWSPDGTKLLYQVGHESNGRIFQIDIDGQNKKELGKGVYPSWQPALGDGPENTEPIAPGS